MKKPSKETITRPEFGKVYPAFMVKRVPGGWSFVRVELDHEYNVVGLHESQPDTKPIITEKFKIEVGKYWMKLDEQEIVHNKD